MLASKRGIRARAGANIPDLVLARRVRVAHKKGRKSAKNIRLSTSINPFLGHFSHLRVPLSGSTSVWSEQGVLVPRASPDFSAGASESRTEREHTAPPGTAKKGRCPGLAGHAVRQVPHAHCRSNAAQHLGRAQVVSRIDSIPVGVGSRE